MNSTSHCVSARIEAPAGEVFAFLSDPVALGDWSLGCMRTAPAGAPGLYSGISLFDGGEGWFRIEATPELMLIDYRVGTPEKLSPRIFARIVPGEMAGFGPDACLALLIAWRPEGMDEARWRRLVAAHEAEIWLIKAQIETKRSNRRP